MIINNIKSVLNYEKETGVFTWAVYRNHKALKGGIPGRLDRDGYLMITVFKKEYSASRLAWAFVNGKFPDEQIDHINGNKLDNRIENLRACTQAQNQQNKASVGVSFNKSNNKWQAQIKKERKNYYIGCFADKDAAIEAYRKKSVDLFGEYSRWRSSVQMDIAE